MFIFCSVTTNEEIWLLQSLIQVVSYWTMSTYQWAEAHIYAKGYFRNCTFISKSRDVTYLGFPDMVDAHFKGSFQNLNRVKFLTTVISLSYPLQMRLRATRDRSANTLLSGYPNLNLITFTVVTALSSIQLIIRTIQINFTIDLSFLQSKTIPPTRVRMVCYQISETRFEERLQTEANLKGKDRMHPHLPTALKNCSFMAILNARGTRHSEIVNCWWIFPQDAIDMIICSFKVFMLFFFGFGCPKDGEEGSVIREHMHISQTDRKCLCNISIWNFVNPGKLTITS